MSNNDFFSGYTSYKDNNQASDNGTPINQTSTEKAITVNNSDIKQEAPKPAFTQKPSRQIQEARYVGEMPRPFLAFLIATSIMGIFMLLQLAVSLPFYSEIMFDAMKITNGDESAALEYYMQVISNSSINTKVLLITTSCSLFAAVIWYYFQYCRKTKLSEIKETCKNIFTLRTIAGLIVGTIALFFLSSIVAAIVMAIFPVHAEEYQRLLELGLADMSSPLVFVIIVILAPINEECIFRGLILTKLKKNMKPSFAIILTGVLFGVFHFNLIQSLYVLPVGIALAYVAWKYQSIIPTMIMHAIYNALNYLIEALPTSLTENNLFIIIVMIVAAVGWYFLEIRKKVERKKADIDYHI